MAPAQDKQFSQAGICSNRFEATPSENHDHHPTSVSTNQTTAYYKNDPPLIFVLGTPQWSCTPLWGIPEGSLVPHDLAHLHPRNQTFYTHDRSSVNINGQNIKYSRFLKEGCPQPMCVNCETKVESMNNWRVTKDKQSWMCSACGK